MSGGSRDSYHRSNENLIVNPKFKELSEVPDNSLFTRYSKNSTRRLDNPSEYLINKAKRAYKQSDRRGEEKSSKAITDLQKAAESSTVYVGNLSFYTTEEQIYELFSKCGRIKRIIMGLNQKTQTPCGFCFVEFYTHQEAIHSIRYLKYTLLEGREISLDMDPGFEEGREYGRGISGGQVQDEFRTNYDAERGGYGRQYDMNVSLSSMAGMTMDYGFPMLNGPM